MCAYVHACVVACASGFARGLSVDSAAGDDKNSSKRAEQVKSKDLTRKAHKTEFLL